MTEHTKDLERRLRDVIVNTCNKIGCDNCGLKWDGGCSATDLQNKLDEAIMAPKEPS